MQQAKGAHYFKLLLSSNLQRTEAHRFYDAIGFERHGYAFKVDLQ